METHKSDKAKIQTKVFKVLFNILGQNGGAWEVGGDIDTQSLAQCKKTSVNH